MSDTSLLNLGELSRPATVLVEKVSDAVGGIFKPYQIVRVAKAEAEAARIGAESRIEIGDIQRRALHRFLEEEAKKQQNMESITRQALPLLSEQSTPEAVSSDWITNFFDKCRIVSDHDMQNLWARILVGEAHSPGAFSRKTVNLLSDLDRGDAELFGRLRQFVWAIGSARVLLIFDSGNPIYTNDGVTFGSLTHLQSLGLIQFNQAMGFALGRLGRLVETEYFGMSLTISLPKESDNQLAVGRALLTRAGEELLGICAGCAVEGFFEFVYDEWANNSYVPKRPPGPESLPEI